MSKAIVVRMAKGIIGLLLLVPAVTAGYVSVVVMPSVWGFVGLLGSLLFGIGFAGVILFEALTGKEIAHLGQTETAMPPQAFDWTNTSWDWSRRADCLTNPASPFYQGRG